MPFEKDIEMWNCASVKIINVKHGLLFRQSITEVFENSSFIYCEGKDGIILLDDVPYHLNSNLLMQIAPDKSVIIEAGNAELEYFAVLYQADLLPDAGRSATSQLIIRNPFTISHVLKSADPAFFVEHFIRMADIL